MGGIETLETVALPLSVKNHMVAQINNQELKRAFSNSTKTQLVEQPNQVVNSAVTPIIDVTPLNHKIIDIIAANAALNATTATIMTTDTKRVFYIVAATLSVIKDATATSISSRVLATINGAATRILGIEGLTLTPQDRSVSISFPKPIKIDKGVNITVTNTTNVANVTSHAIIYGYYEDEI